jgi:hypothetical protein
MMVQMTPWERVPPYALLRGRDGRLHVVAPWRQLARLPGTDRPGLEVVSLPLDEWRLRDGRPGNRYVVDPSIPVPMLVPELADAIGILTTTFSIEFLAER